MQNPKEFRRQTYTSIIINTSQKNSSIRGSDSTTNNAVTSGARGKEKLSLSKQKKCIDHITD